MSDDPEEQATEPVSCAVLEAPGEKPAKYSKEAMLARFGSKKAPAFSSGQSGNPLGRKGKRGLSQRTLEARIKEVLQSKDGKLMQALAESIVEGAIAREPACLNWLGDRLWKAEQGQEQGRVVIQGIRLELPNPSPTNSLEPLEAPILSVSTSVGTDVREES